MTYTVISAAACALLMISAAHAETVEIYALDMLDNNQNGYCLDISGGQGAQADPANGLQGHTCYSPSGEIFVDQGFDSTRFADGIFYMPGFDVCMQAAAIELGAALELAACAGSELHGFAFTGEGTITPASAPDLCVTLGENTRSGRSEANQIKALSLQACDKSLSAYQLWSARTASE